MSFHRDVQLQPQYIRIMLSSVNFCRQAGGVSLQLKWHELYLQQEDEMSQLMFQLLSQLFEVPVRDLLDESSLEPQVSADLWRRRSDPTQGPERWETASALLRVLQRPNHTMQLLLSGKGKALIERQEEEAFPLIHFLPGQHLDDIMPLVRWAILEDLMKQPPYEMFWLKKLQRQ